MSSPKESMSVTTMRASLPPSKLIDIDSQWSQRELEFYLNASQLTKHDTSLGDEDKVATEQLNSLLMQNRKRSAKKTPEYENRQLARGGLKTEMDFLTLINGPRGKLIKTIIGLEIKRQEDIKLYQQAQNLKMERRQSLIRKLIIFFVAMYYLETKAFAMEQNAATMKKEASDRQEVADEYQGAYTPVDESAIEDQIQQIESMIEQQREVQDTKDELAARIDELERYEPIAKERTERLAGLETDITQALQQNDTLHERTAELLNPDTETTVEDKAAHIASIQEKIQFQRDRVNFLQEQQFNPRGELLDLSETHLRELTKHQIMAASRLEDLMDDLRLLHKDELFDIQEQLETPNDEPKEISVAEQSAIREKLCEYGLITEDDRDYRNKKGEGIHPRDFLNRNNRPFNLYDAEGKSLPSHERSNATYMIPTRKHLLVIDGVAYVVPKDVKDKDALKEKSLDEQLAYKHEAEHGKYRTMHKTCELSLVQSKKDHEACRETHKGEKSAYDALLNQEAMNDHDLQNLTADLATSRAQRENVLSGDNIAAPAPSPSRGSSKSASAIKPCTRVHAALKALELHITDELVERLRDAVGVDNFSPGEYKTLQEIFTKGNAEEKRQLFQNLERIPGGILASYKEQMSSPFSTVQPAGSPKRDLLPEETNARSTAPVPPWMNTDPPTSSGRG